MARKRLVLGLVVGVAVFAASFGMAASLGGLTSEALGAEDVVVAACETATPAPSVNYTTAFNGGAAVTTDGYNVASIVIDDLDNTCDGDAVKITLTDADGASLQEHTTTVPIDSTATTVTFDITDSTLAESVRAVHVVISG